jgi:outer membrane protein
MAVKTSIATVVTIALALGTQLSGAAEPNSASAASAERQSNWRLGIALGYGSRTNPLIQSDDVPVLVDVDIAWFGKRWLFDNGDVGLMVFDGPAATANVIARVNSDRVFFGKTNSRFVSIGATGAVLSAPVSVEPPDRDYAIELGAELLFDGEWGELQLAAYQDVSDTHRGQHAYVDYRYAWQRGRLRIAPSVGLHYKSAALNDYYWGVRANEANAALPAYRAGAGANLVGNLETSYYLSRHLRIALAINYEHLDSEVRASPIVDRSAVLGYFAGFSYRF